jgi:hypothetical protein
MKDTSSKYSDVHDGSTQNNLKFCNAKKEGWFYTEDGIEYLYFIHTQYRQGIVPHNHYHLSTSASTETQIECLLQDIQK